MRVQVRTIIDTEQPVNLRELTPKEKLLVAFKKEWQQSEFYKKTKYKMQQESHQERSKKEDNAKEFLLAKIHQELNTSKSLQAKGLESKEIVVLVDAKFKDVLFDQVDDDGEIVYTGILNHVEFAPYAITAVPENADLRRAFPNMPFMFRCARKVI